MNTNLNHHFRRAALMGAMTFCITVYAAEQSPCASDAADSHQRHEPPPQAYQDCKGKQVGDVVQTTPPHRGTISATCTSSAKGLFARPDHPPSDRDESAKDQNK